VPVKHYWNEEVETMPQAKLAKIEGALLSKETAYIYEHSPFYRQKMDKTNVKPEDIKTIEDITKLPFTTKDDLRKSQVEFGGLGGHQCAPKEKLVRIQGTSGTTGRPLFIGLTARDANSWKELFARHADLSYRAALRVTRNAADAEDAVQSAFVRIMQDAVKYRGGKGVKVWITKMVINTAKDQIKGAVRRRGREEKVGGEVVAIVS